MTKTDRKRKEFLEKALIDNIDSYIKLLKKLPKEDKVTPSLELVNTFKKLVIQLAPEVIPDYHKLLQSSFGLVPLSQGESVDDIIGLPVLDGITAKELISGKIRPKKGTLEQGKPLEEKDLDAKFVNSPRHYNTFLHDYVSLIEGTYGTKLAVVICDAMALKYALRAGFKNTDSKETNDGASQDLKKRDWYLNYRQMLESDTENSRPASRKIQCFLDNTEYKI